MEQELILVNPSEEYLKELLDYRNEFLANGNSMDGCGPLRKFTDMKEYLNETNKYLNPATLPEGMVIATQFLCIRKSDNKLVGMIQVRHYFNEYLEKYAGHIGYSVRPSERRKGYASWMLNNIKPFCRSIGLDKILVCCLNNNVGSRKTILTNGGIYYRTYLSHIHLADRVECDTLPCRFSRGLVTDSSDGSDWNMVSGTAGYED